MISVLTISFFFFVQIRHDALQIQQKLELTNSADALGVSFSFPLELLLFILIRIVEQLLKMRLKTSKKLYDILASCLGLYVQVAESTQW